MNENNVHLLSAFSGYELITVFKSAKSDLNQMATKSAKRFPRVAQDYWRIIAKLSACNNVLKPNDMYVLAEIGELVEEEENNG